MPWNLNVLKFWKRLEILKGLHKLKSFQSYQKLSEKDFTVLVYFVIEPILKNVLKSMKFVFGIGVKTHLSWILWNWRIEIPCAQADSGLGGWRYVTPLDPRVGPGSSIDPHSWTPEQWLGGRRYVTPQGTRVGVRGDGDT